MTESINEAVALLPFGPAIAQPEVVQITWNAAGVRTVNGVPDSVAQSVKPEPPMSGRAAYEGMREAMLCWQGRALEAEASNRQLVRALREEVEGTTFMGEPVIQPAIAQSAQPIGGEVTAPALTPEMRESLNSRLSDHWYGCADDVWRLIWATATSTKPVAQEPLQEAKDSERLKFMASRPSRYVEYDRNALYRVYEDAATALAEHAEWKAMTPAYYGTANAAIDAAIASQKGSV